MHINTRLLFLLQFLFVACSGQNPAPTEKHTAPALAGDTVTAIGMDTRCIFQDSKNNFWFGTDGQGVFKYDGKSLVQYTDKQGLCSNFVWTVQEDRSGNLWFKTRDAVCRFDGSTFTRVNVQKEEDPFQIPSNPGSVGEDFLGGYSLSEGSLRETKLPHTSPLLDNTPKKFEYDIYSTLRDQSGRSWFGTCTAGVCIYDGKTYNWLDYKELGAPVRTMFQDKNGVIWIGNNGYGLLRYDGKNLRNITRENHLENPGFLKNSETKPGTLARVWSITDDKEGNLWIGVIDTGVWKYDGKTLTQYTTRDGLGSDSIWTIYRDKNDQLWFGTADAGVYTFDGQRFIPFMGQKH